MKPLVAELNNLWNGVILKDHDGISVIVRAALLCSSCDIPANRKVCGFVSHNALKGCSKCLLSFPTDKFGEKPDYSNFNKSEWVPRTNEQPRRDVEKMLNKGCSKGS